METKIILFHGTRVSYKIYGEGKPVVLLHGFGEDSSIWDGQVKFLKDHFRLIVPDIPGSGVSEMLQNETAQISDYAEAVKAIFDEERLSAVVLIGHSMGGYISLAFAKKYPKLLSALGLFHSGAYADDADKIATRKKAIEFIQKNGSKSFLQTSIPGLFYDTEESKAGIDTLVGKADRFLPEALIQYYHAMIARPDTTKVLRSFRSPILFIAGGHDKAIPLSHSLRQCHIPAETHIHILRNSAHMGMLEEALRSNEILAEFLHSI